MKRIFDIDNKWFFSPAPTWQRLFLIFIKGDALVILPFIVLIVLTAFFSFKLALIILGLYISIRQFGEMMFWFFQQFGPRTYRPHDFGFKKLDNHAIYILYQTWALATTVMGVTFLIYVIMYIK